MPCATWLLRPLKTGFIILILLFEIPEVISQEPPTISGGWTATVAQARPLRGRWIGQTLPGEPNQAHGSWTITSDTGKTVMRGTWSSEDQVAQVP